MPKLKPEEIVAYKKGSLLLDCQLMELRGTPGQPDKVVSGAGYISQQLTGDLTFALFDTTVQTDDSIGLHSWPPSETGSLIPQEAYSQLTAYDTQGRMWRSTTPRASFSQVLAQPGIVWRGSLRHLETVPENPDRQIRGLWMFLPTSAEIVANQYTITQLRIGEKTSSSYLRNVWELTTDALEIRISRVADGIEVEVESVGADTYLPRHIDTRLEEALWLVLSRLVSWTILYKGTPHDPTIHLRKRTFPDVRPRLSPPIDLDFEHEKAIGLLLATYLHHILKYEGPTYHPISADWRMFLSASALTVEQEALHLGVTVESVLRREFPDYGQPDKELLSSVDALSDVIMEWKGDEKVKKRAINAVGRLKEQNGRSALLELVDKGVIRRAHYDAWVRLRNPAAHGNHGLRRPFETSKLCDQVYQLLILLVAHTIGFEGYIHDYTVLGWPLIECPLKPT